jgi:hypothetical protein
MMRRAYATAARIALARRTNAAALHGEATEALERWVAPGALEGIYVNHPEPPQQAASAGAKGGSGAKPHAEASHMLDERLLTAAARALKPGGTLTIVTDSAFYADMLLDAIARHPAYAPTLAATIGTQGAKVVRARDGFELLSARPGPWCGHATDASSYFDRLWQTGLSVHSEAHDRFVLHVQAVALDGARPQGAGKPSREEVHSSSGTPPSPPAAAVAAASKGHKRARPDGLLNQGEDPAANDGAVEAPRKKKRKKKKNKGAGDNAT